MWFDLDTEENHGMIHQYLDSKWQPNGKERNIFFIFDLCSREVSDGNDKDRVITFLYEIRYASDKAYMLKNLLYKVSSEDPHFNFIPYELNSVTTSNTMKKIILRQNTFLEEMDIAQINGILQNDELKVLEYIK